MALILDAQFVGSDDSNNGLNYDTARNKIAVQFVPSVTFPVGKVSLYLAKHGSPTFNIKASIFSDNADQPNAIIGSSSSSVAASGISTVISFVDLTFPTPPSVTASTKYWIVLDGDYGAPDTTNYVGWDSDTTTPGYGSKGLATWNGSAWTVTAGTTEALSFKEYYDNTPAVGGDENAYFL